MDFQVPRTFSIFETVKLCRRLCAVLTNKKTAPIGAVVLRLAVHQSRLLASSRGRLVGGLDRYDIDATSFAVELDVTVYKGE